MIFKGILQYKPFHDSFGIPNLVDWHMRSCQGHKAETCFNWDNYWDNWDKLLSLSVGSVELKVGLVLKFPAQP